MENLEQKIASLSLDGKKKLIRQFYAQNLNRYFQDLVWTLDEYDTTGNPIKKFPWDWDYTRELVKDLDSEKWLYIWKSRQVMVTWTVLAYALWLVLFHKGKKVGIQTLDATKSDALIKRMKVIYDKLPSWKPIAEFTENRIKIEENTSDVFGMPSGGDQFRSFSFSFIFSDEFGMQEKLEDTFTAAQPIVNAGGRFVAATTPPKEKNYAYSLLKNKLFKVHTVHYSKRPDRDAAWVASSKPGWDEERWAREQELTIAAVGVKRIFSTFTMNAHVNGNLRVVSNSTIYRSWDFGYHRPAVIFAQIDSLDRISILEEIVGKDELIDNFADRILAFTNLHFPGCGVRDFCDIAGTQVNDKTEKTSIQILQSKGIRPTYRKVNDEDGFNLIRRKMSTFIGDRPAFQVHPNCQILIDAFLFGAVYGVDGITPKFDGQDEYGQKEKGYYGHLIDALKYFLGNVYAISGQQINNNLKTSALKNPDVPNSFEKVKNKNPLNPNWMLTGKNYG